MERRASRAVGGWACGAHLEARGDVGLVAFPQGGQQLLLRQLPQLPPELLDGLDLLRHQGDLQQRGDGQYALQGFGRKGVR